MQPISSLMCHFKVDNRQILIQGFNYLGTQKRSANNGMDRRITRIAHNIVLNNVEDLRGV